MVLFIMLYKVVLTFSSDNEILKCNHSYGSNRALHSYVVVRFLQIFNKTKFDNKNPLKCATYARFPCVYTNRTTNTPSYPCIGSPAIILLADGSIETTPSTLSLAGM